MSARTRICIVVPSLKISGGTLELLRLAYDLETPDREISLLTMWRSPHETPLGLRSIKYLSSWPTKARSAFVQLPLLLLRFWRLCTVRRTDQIPVTWIFSHYATLPLALCVPRNRRWFFVQDIEWRFLANPLLAGVLRRVILYFYARGRLISANPYLTSELKSLGMQVALEAPIWADVQFGGDGSLQRDIDVTMVLRKGDHKRTDLYLKCIDLARSSGKAWRMAVITPEDDIHAQVAHQVSTCLLRPTAQTMREIYARSRIFLHLSEHEGFGLPPLEAMGSGCVPVCRDSGGIQAYMTGRLRTLVHPKELSMQALVDEVDSLLKDGGRWSTMSALAKHTFDQGMSETGVRRGALSEWQFEPGAR